MVQLTRLNPLQNFKRSIRMFQLFLAIAVMISANWVSAEQQFPYVAYVTKPDSYVRSGPGQRYYPTQQLRQGYAVEVYRHDGDRWCAVRPPEGSYSVVAAHQVNQLGQGIAEVSAEQTVTRVGSLLSPDRSAIQVLLPRGERVKVLESSATDDARWLKIAAPAGEFRWLAADDLSPQPPVETTPPPQVATSWTQQSSVTQASATQQFGSFDHLAKPPASLQFTEVVAIPSSTPNTPPAGNDLNTMDIVAGSPAELQLAQFQAEGSGLQASQLQPAITPTVGLPLGKNIPNSTSTSPRIRFRGLSATQAPATPRVAELELRLSEIIIRSREEWQFGQLKAETNGLLAATNLPGERTRLREVLERISRFEQVQQRYAMPAVVASRGTIIPVTSPVTQESPREEFTGRTSKVLELIKNDLGGGAAMVATSENGGEAPRYDAVGILKPVVSKREKAPQFALVDDRGAVVSFVTPTPDLNLQPYLGQRIGVHGKRDYLQEFRRAHVAARSITPIEGRIRR